MNNEQKIQFGHLTKEDKLKLMSEWLDGEQLQFWYVNKWVDINATPGWSDTVIYRVKTLKEYIKPSIHWQHVHKDFICLTIDEDGPFLFTCHMKPDLEIKRFVSGQEYTAAYAGVFTSFNPGSFVPDPETGKVKDWQESIIYRPGFEPR